MMIDRERAFVRLLDESLSQDAQVDLLKSLPEFGLSGEQLARFVATALSRAVPVSIVADNAVDLVGTGGDKHNTFNISTTAAILASAAGVNILKHGNRAVTSKSGSFDCLEALHISMPESSAAVKTQFDRCGIAFLFARHFHPSFKKIAPARQQLAAKGMRSVFNILGPLLNPARLKRFVIGVYDPRLLEPMAKALQLMNVDRALVCHGAGLDELSLLGDNQVIEVSKIGLTASTLDVRTLGFSLCTLDAILGGESEYNARLTEDILSGKIKGPRRDIVVLNAAAAIMVSRDDIHLSEGISLAAEAIDRGDAHRLLMRLREQSA